MKKYILNQLTQISSWIGLILIFAALLAPRDWIAILGIVMFFSNDTWLKNIIVRQAPWIKEILDEIDEELK